MATSGAKPTVVFVQGSFQTKAVYQKLVQGLQSQPFRYPVVYPALPSCTDTTATNFASRTLTDDANAVRRELVRLIKVESKVVIVVMHSYGGLVGCEAIPDDLGFSYRQSKGLSGGVVHLFFYSAFILPKGQSVLSAFGESPNNDIRPNGRFTIRNAAKTLYNDLPKSEAELWESRIIVQSRKVQETRLTNEPYRNIPSTYLICDKDQAAPPAFQEQFAKSIQAKIEHCSAGHSPHLSQPIMLVNKIDAMIKMVAPAISPVGMKKSSSGR